MAVHAGSKRLPIKDAGDCLSEVQVPAYAGSKGPWPLGPISWTLGLPGPMDLGPGLRKAVILEAEGQLNGGLAPELQGKPCPYVQQWRDLLKYVLTGWQTMADKMMK